MTSSNVPPTGREDGSPRRTDRGRTPGPRRRLSRAGIVDAAIHLIEADGLSVLSMRRLADALGVAPGTVYTYVSDRAELLTLILDTIMGRDDLPHEFPGTWREKLEHWTRSDFEGLCARPWVLQLRGSVNQFGPNMVLWFDSALRVFDGLDVPEPIKMHMIGTLDAYVIGSAAAHLESMVDDSPASDLEQATLAAISAAPALRNALTQAPRTFDTERFEFGLACLLDGFAAQLAVSGRGRGHGQ